MAITSDGRGYAAGKFAVELDGIMAGWLWSAEGGHATSDVVVEKLGPDHIQKKHIAGVKYEDISLSCGTGMSKGFYNWIKDSFDHKYSRKNGALITADYNFKEHGRLSFFNALITEVGMPALDAGSKDAAKMTIKFAPEYTRATPTKGGGPVVAGKFSTNPLQKQWSPANFTIDIDGLDCKKVNKIEGLTVKQKVVENPIGEGRDYEKEPTGLEIPNLVVTLPESHADTWYKWHEDFVIKGNCTEMHEKHATLTYLAPDRKTPLFNLTFQHLGIFKLTPDKLEAGSEQIRRVKAEMYCENIKFDFQASWA